MLSNLYRYITGSSVVEVEVMAGNDGSGPVTYLRKMTDWQSWVMSAAEKSGMAAVSGGPPPPGGKPPGVGSGAIKSVEELTSEFVKVSHTDVAAGGKPPPPGGKPPMPPPGATPLAAAAAKSAAPPAKEAKVGNRSTYQVKPFYLSSATVLPIE